MVQSVLKYMYASSMPAMTHLARCEWGYSGCIVKLLVVVHYVALKYDTKG